MLEGNTAIDANAGLEACYFFLMNLVISREIFPTP